MLHGTPIFYFYPYPQFINIRQNVAQDHLEQRARVLKSILQIETFHIITQGKT